MKKRIYCIFSIIVIFLVLDTTASAATYLWPVPGITYISQGYSSGHPGIDIADNGDCDIVAAREGTVIAAASTSCTHWAISHDTTSPVCNYGMGNYVQIRHSDNSYATYMHMEYGSVTVSVGDYVSRGTKIGKMGASGNATGKHLHFQVGYSRTETINVNPDVLGYDYNNDSTPPTIKNYRTTNVTAQSITVSMDLNDNVGVTSVKFNVWGPNGHKGYSVSASNGTFSHTIKTSDYGGEGSYSIHVNVYDAAGNDTFAKLSGIPTPANFGDSFFGIISHHASGKPIEVGEDKYIVIGTKNGKANQVWKFQRESDGCYTIASNKTKNLLEMSGGNRENGTQASAGVEDWGGYYQRWYIYPQGDGYVILSKHYTDYRRVLDVDGGGSTDGTKILTYERLNNSNQIFDITKLTVPTLSVSAGTSAQSTVFKWDDFYGSESYYDLKLWNGTYWVGDTYRLEWNTKSPCAIHLPAGHYEGYVDFTIGKLGAMSNVVKFDVTEDNSRVNVFSRRTVTDTGYDIHADIKYLNQSAVYVAALYSSDGKLLDVRSTPISSGATSADVAFTKQAGAAYVKIFLWDSLQSMQPLTESEKINL